MGGWQAVKCTSQACDQLETKKKENLEVFLNKIPILVGHSCKNSVIDYTFERQTFQCKQICCQMNRNVNKTKDPESVRKEVA